MHKVPIKRVCAGTCVTQSYTKLRSKIQVLFLVINTSQENQVLVILQGHTTSAPCMSLKLLTRLYIKVAAVRTKLPQLGRV